MGICLILAINLHAQELQNENVYFSYSDSIALSQLPLLTLPDSYKGKSVFDLPYSLDNSQTPYFRSIFGQDGWSCGQASSIGYNFTYEINRRRNLPSDTSINQYPSHFAFNFFNYGENAVGVNYIHTFDLLKEFGTPNVATYGGMSLGLTHWMNGYENYYSAMLNKMDEVYGISVADEEGILTLKNWLNDHLDGSEYGGLANFYTDLAGLNSLPAGTPEEGKRVITAFGQYNGHSMTIVGWNDSIRWDYNNDSIYTNDLDINGDNVVNVKDWEIGGVKIANSHSVNWADSGFSYVMYKVLAEEKSNGGIWNKMVHVIDVKPEYSPMVTYKVKLKYNSRERIKIVAGISPDTNDLLPLYKLEFSGFNYQGGDHYMQGNDTLEDHKTITFGLDVTPLLSFIEPGMPAKFFLEVHEYDPMELQSGMLMEYSMFDYQNGGIEVPSNVSDLILNNNSITIASVVHPVNFDKVDIETDDLGAFVPGQAYNMQLQAFGGTEPYDWKIKTPYSINESACDYPDIQGEKIFSGSVSQGFLVKKISFAFPFFGKTYDTLTLNVDGFINFTATSFPIPYQRSDMGLFKYEPMIAPFLNKQLVFSGSQNGIWYEGSDDLASFRWKALVQNEGGDYPVDFSVIIYADGEIEFYYLENPSGELIRRVTGISNGDGTNYQTSDFMKEFPDFGSTKISLSPKNFLTQLEVDNSGLLHADDISGNKIYDIVVEVKDMNEIKTTKTFQLSESIVFDYVVNSGDDHRIDYGETAHLDFEITNIGDNPVNNLIAQINIDDTYITLIDDIQTFTTINPGETVLIADAFSFNVDPYIPDNYILNFDILFNWGSDVAEGTLNFEAYSPIFEAIAPIVYDNENGKLDPGESAGLIFSVNNFGHALANNVTAEITINTPYISVYGSESLTLGDIPAGGTASDTLFVTVSEFAPQGYQFEIIFSIHADPGFVINNSFYLLIGRFPLLIIDLDPQLLNGPEISFLLDDLEVYFEYINYIPENLDNYQNLMIFLGRKFFNYTLSPGEGEQLAEFLDDNRNIFMEGGVTWLEDPQTSVHSMFSFEVEPINWNYHDSIFGISGTFTENMNFDYNGNLGYYNHILVPTGNAFKIFNTSNPEHGCMVAYENEKYKTIGSNIDFIGLTGDTIPSSKKYLLSCILEFFNLNYVYTDDNSLAENSGIPAISSYPNPFSDNLHIVVNLNSTEDYKLVLYTIHGKALREIGSGEKVNELKHGHDINLSDLNPGVYMCGLITPSKKAFVKIVKSY